MADSWFLFENIFEDGTLTADEEAAGFPVSNTTDWREETSYRWKTTDTTSLKYMTVDLGAGNTANPDTCVISGHNLFTAGATILYVRASTDDFAASDVLQGTFAAPTDDATIQITFTPTATDTFRYWRLQLQDPGTWNEVTQLGIVTLGRRLDFESGFGVRAGLDIYGERFNGNVPINGNGSPLGGNLRFVDKSFNLDISNPGMTTTNFFDKAAPNFNTTFRDHARQMKPFWYAWNTDTDARAVYLSWTDGYQQPFEFITTRRGLRMTLKARVIV